MKLMRLCINWWGWWNRDLRTLLFIMMVWSEAIQLFLQYADVRLSFTDCVSFALLQRMGITEVFGFDAHFGLMGVMLQPQG